MLIGYARVSTLEQNLGLQQDALHMAGCEKIFVDRISGVKAQRPGLAQLEKILRKGDTLVVWRLDRLGRSLRDLLDWTMKLEEQEIGLKSLQEAIDTTTSTGKLVFHIFGALSEFERNLIRERTMAGLHAARARGRLGGRKPALSQKDQKRLKELYEQKQLQVKELCEMFKITKTSVYRYVKG